ncbi:MAG: hypothetical protein P1T08_12900 [Acidimicrobiia bacterium]|nr:hypothetical protein [Acidimicrobiia bacterium]
MDDETRGPVSDDILNFEGVEGSFEHRTVGPHRARCLTDSEWCYPDDLCDCCRETLGYRKVWVGADDEATIDRATPVLIVMVMFALYGTGVGVVLGWLIWG